MANPEAPDDTGVAARGALRREEGALAPFFDAARAERIEPSAAFLSAVIADAAAASARRAAPFTPRRPWPNLGALSRPLGGWGAAAALGGCMALGFWAGSLGAGADLAADAFRGAAAVQESALDGLDDFFDLAAAEG